MAKEFNLREIVKSVVYEQTNNREPEEPEPCLWQDDLEQALWTLADCLPNDYHSDIVVTGGCVLILFHNIDIGTSDIDGYERFLYTFDEILLDGIADTVQIARNNNSILPDDWFNNHMFECIQPNDIYDTELMEDNLDTALARDYYKENGKNTISLIPVTLDALLFSKFEAGRDKDFRHIAVICALMDLRTVEEIEAVLSNVCPQWDSTYNYRSMHHAIKYFYNTWLYEYDYTNYSNDE